METLGGRYRLEGKIAEGAIGAVYRATDTRTGQVVAVKSLRPEAAARPELVAAFVAEGAILGEVSHPSIIRLVDTLTTGAPYAIVLELVDGSDLRLRLREEGPLSPAAAIGLTARVADALAHLHARGIVHGDVKPGNLLLPDDGGPVRLADFGVARRLADTDRDRVVQATPEYAAPEVVAGAHPGPAADVYALGIVLFELLSGRSPFRGGPAGQVLNRHGRCTPVPPPGLPPVVWPLIEACVAARPEARPDAAVLAGRLRETVPAVAGMAALARPSSDQITWWPRSAGATTAVARVSWVPLRAAPVSPAAAYAGRMVAIPLADLPTTVASRALPETRALPRPWASSEAGTPPWASSEAGTPPEPRAVPPTRALPGTGRSSRTGGLPGNGASGAVGRSALVGGRVWTRRSAALGPAASAGPVWPSRSVTSDGPSGGGGRWRPGQASPGRPGRVLGGRTGRPRPVVVAGLVLFVALAGAVAAGVAVTDVGDRPAGAPAGASEPVQAPPSTSGPAEPSGEPPVRRWSGTPTPATGGPAGPGEPVELPGIGDPLPHLAPR